MILCHRFLLFNMRVYVEADVRRCFVTAFVIYAASSSRSMHLLFSVTVHLIYHVIYDASRSRSITFLFWCVWSCDVHGV